MIKCLIFDLDGTLFDSTEANVRAYKQAFLASGLKFDEVAYRKLFGLRYSEMIRQLAPKADLKKHKRVKLLKSGFYKENLNLVRKNDGLFDLLVSVQGKFKTALVTTASKQNVTNLLRYFHVRQSLFNIIVTGEDVINGKPDPECYLITLQKLDLTADACLVFEDSLVGIEAARLAGIHVLKVSL